MLLCEMPNPQANTLNHPAGISYLKRKETSTQRLFTDGVPNTSACTSCPPTTRAEYGKSKQGRPAQQPAQPHRTGPWHRHQREKAALAALVSPAQASSGPAVGFLAEPPHLH